MRGFNRTCYTSLRQLLPIGWRLDVDTTHWRLCTSPPGRQCACSYRVFRQNRNRFLVGWISGFDYAEAGERSPISSPGSSITVFSTACALGYWVSPSTVLEAACRFLASSPLCRMLTVDSEPCEIRGESSGTTMTFSAGLAARAARPRYFNDCRCTAADCFAKMSCDTGGATVRSTTDAAAVIP